MRHTGKVTAILLAIVVLAMSCFCVSAEKTGTKLYRYRDYEYFYRGNSAQIFDYCGTESKLKIPSKINGRKIIKIGYDDDTKFFYYEPAEGWWHYGFWYNGYVEEVSLPETVTELGYECFAYCDRLRKVKLGNGIKRLNKREFAQCERLKSLNMPESLEDFCVSSIAGTRIKKVRFGKNLKKFDDEFYAQLESISVSKKNKRFSSEKGVLYNKKKTKLIYYPSESKRKSIKLPDTITELDDIYWTKLESITLPKKLKKLKYTAIEDNQKLTQIKFTGKEKITVEKRAVYNCRKLKTVTIPENVVKIGKKAFGFWEYEYKKNGEYISEDKKIEGFTIRGKKDSAAYKYAKKYGFSFIEI
jgi:hypothetical protein